MHMHKFTHDKYIVQKFKFTITLKNPCVDHIEELLFSHLSLFWYMCPTLYPEKSKWIHNFLELENEDRLQDGFQSTNAMLKTFKDKLFEKICFSFLLVNVHIWKNVLTSSCKFLLCFSCHEFAGFPSS